MIELTICMPAYNAGKYIHDAIRSVVEQTYGDFKFIIYNDGSTDDTVNIIKSFNDKRIELIDCSENKGGLFARSEIIRRIDTPYAMWIDADDRFSRNDVFAECLDIVRHGNYDLVNFAKNYEITCNGDKVINYNCLYGDFEYCGDKLFEKFYPTDNHFIFHGKVFKSEILKSSIPEDLIGKRFITDDMFFSAVWFYCSKRYRHIVDDYEPIYEYKNSIGIWGANTHNVTLERIGGLCLLQYNCLVSLYNRLNAIKVMNPIELNNLINGINFPMIPRIINGARNQLGNEYADSLLYVWHSAFAEDGIHLLNGIELFAVPEYIKYLEGIMK